MTTFTYRGTEYTVSGWLGSTDGAQDGIVVRRADGAPIRGVTMHPGMVQTGLSDALERAAVQALTAARERVET